MRTRLLRYLVAILLSKGFVSASSQSTEVNINAVDALERGHQISQTSITVKLSKRKAPVDLCVDIWSQPDPCAFIRSNVCDHTIASQVNYAEGFFCAPTPAKVFVVPAYILWMLYLFIFAGVVSSDFFTPSLSNLFNVVISSASPSFFVSILILALGNGSFDLLASTAAMKSNSAAIAFGGLIGAAFITSILTPAWVAIIHPYTLVKRGFVRDCIFTLASLVLIFITLLDNDISVMESLFLIAFYCGYLIIRVGWKVFVGEDHQQSPAFRAVENDDDLEDDMEAQTSSNATKPLLARIINSYLPPEPNHLDGQVRAASGSDTVVAQKTEEALSTLLPRSERKSVYGSILASEIISDPMDQAKYNDEYLPTSRGFAGYVVASILVISRLFIPQTGGTKFSMNLSSALGGTIFAWGFLDFWHFRLGWLATTAIVIVAAILFGLVSLLIEESTDFYDSPHIFYRITRVVASFSLIYILANEAVGLVVTMALILNFSKTFVGLTIFAAGLSFGDLIANITLAKNGYPSISTKSALATPMLNLTGGTGLAALYVLVVHEDTTPTGKLALITSPSILAATICLFMLVMTMMIGVVRSQFKIEKTHGMVLIVGFIMSVFIVFITEAVLGSISPEGHGQ